jgi:hypothetical protein
MVDGRWSHSLLIPARKILPIINLHRCLGEHQGPEGVDHYGQFLSFLFANASLVCAWVGAVRNPAWVKRHVTLRNIIAAHKITIYIVEYLVGINVAVIIGGRNSQRMVVI